MQTQQAKEILQFWFEEIDHSHWFVKDSDFDQKLEHRFGDLLSQAKKGLLDDWCDSPQGRLALIIVLDQFSRNLYRDNSRAFAADAKALRLAVDGIEKKLDEKLSMKERSFFYMPLRHAENLEMQKLGLTKTRELNDAGYGTDRYALNHLELIERYGRFPHRNKILGRANTPEEEEYIKGGGGGF